MDRPGNRIRNVNGARHEDTSRFVLLGSLLTMQQLAWAETTKLYYCFISKERRNFKNETSVRSRGEVSENFIFKQFTSKIRDTIFGEWSVEGYNYVSQSSILFRWETKFFELIKRNFFLKQQRYLPDTWQKFTITRNNCVLNIITSTYYNFEYLLHRSVLRASFKFPTNVPSNLTIPKTLRFPSEKRKNLLTAPKAVFLRDADNYSYPGSRRCDDKAKVRLARSRIIAITRGTRKGFGERKKSDPRARGQGGDHLARPRR